MFPSSWWEGILPEKLRWLISSPSSTIYEREALPARTQKYWHYVLLMALHTILKKYCSFNLCINYDKLCEIEKKQPIVKENIVYKKNIAFWRIFSMYFPTFGMNTKIYLVNLRIQSECGRMKTREAPNTKIFTQWFFL